MLGKVRLAWNAFNATLSGVGLVGRDAGLRFFSDID